MKSKFCIEEIKKSTAKNLIEKHHYLGKKDFLFQTAYGLIDRKTNELLGVATFGRVNGVSTTKGWFGIGNGAEESKGLYELNRLVMKPNLNGKNYTSFFLGNTLKKMKREQGARAIISLADSGLHLGYIYQACNFEYYGITDRKTDFYMEFENENGYKLNPIGKTKDKKGVWLPRSRKHRYVMIYDKNIVVNYEKLPYPKTNITNKNCCGGEKKVFDKRFNVEYTCPKCTGELKSIF